MCRPAHPTRRRPHRDLRDQEEILELKRLLGLGSSSGSTPSGIFLFPTAPGRPAPRSPLLPTTQTGPWWSPYLQMLLAGPGPELCPAGPGAQLHRADPLSKLEGVERLAGVLLHGRHLGETRVHSPPRPATPQQLEGAACSAEGAHSQGTLEGLLEKMGGAGGELREQRRHGQRQRGATCEVHRVHVTSSAGEAGGCTVWSSACFGAAQDKWPFRAQPGYLGGAPGPGAGRAPVLPAAPTCAPHLHHHEGLAVPTERVLQQVGELGVAEGHVALAGAQGSNDVPQG